MNDLAKFRPKDIQAVYGERPVCFLTLSHQWVDPHHILGRRGPNNERALMSSVFNFCPLDRNIHNGPHRDAPEMRMLFLRLARQHVMNAVNTGAYQLNDNDRAFLMYADQWIAKTFPQIV